MLVFEERGKPEYSEKNLSKQRREPTTNSTHIWRRVRESNPGHIGGRRALSPLRHPCSPTNYFVGGFYQQQLRLPINARTHQGHLVIEDTTGYSLFYSPGPTILLCTTRDQLLMVKGLLGF